MTNDSKQQLVYNDSKMQMILSCSSQGFQFRINEHTWVTHTLLETDFDLVDHPVEPAKAEVVQKDQLLGGQYRANSNAEQQNGVSPRVCGNSIRSRHHFQRVAKPLD